MDYTRREADAADFYREADCRISRVVSNRSIIANLMQHMLKENLEYLDAQHGDIEDIVGVGGFGDIKAVLSKNALGSPVSGVKCIDRPQSCGGTMSRMATPCPVSLVGDGRRLPCFVDEVGINGIAQMISTVRLPGWDSRP